MNLVKLRQLETAQNAGRGVSCVRTIIIFLEKADADSAIACFANEYDKIRNYPEIEKEIRTILGLE